MHYFTYFGVLRMHYFTYFEHFQCLILHVLSIFNALKKEVRSPNRTTQVIIQYCKSSCLRGTVRRPYLLLVVLISSEYISCIYLVLNIVEAVVKAVGNDSFAKTLKFVKVVNDTTAKECCAILKCRLVDDNLGTFSFYTFHNALNSRLAEVI